MNFKIIRLAVLLPILALPSVVKAAPAIDPQSEYAKAVKAYLDAASDQMKAVRDGVDVQLKGAPEDVKARFKKVYEGLDQSDALLARLKSAPSAEFDRLKAEFELVRTQAFKELDTARKG